MRLLAVLSLVALVGLAPALANDTSLNVNVDPPRQLNDYAMPVRMAAEHITVHFGKERSRVEVEFTFANISDQSVYCTGGFPDEDLLMRYAYFAPPNPDGTLPGDKFENTVATSDGQALSLDDTSVLTDFKAWTRPVNKPATANQPLPTKLIRIERIAYEPDALGSLGGEWKPMDTPEFNNLMFCHSFELKLEALQKVVIGHNYNTANGSNVESQILFNYTLGTGRTWAGRIGQATIDAYLEDGLTVDDLKFKDAPDDIYATTSPQRREWHVVDKKHLQAVWKDFEPEDQRSYIMLATKPKPHPAE